jgi:hypothetical protein
VALVSVIWVTQPWSPPPPSATAVGVVGVTMWLLPVWGRWIDAHRVARSDGGAAGGVEPLRSGP